MVAVVSVPEVGARYIFTFSTKKHSADPFPDPGQ